MAFDALDVLASDLDISIIAYGIRHADIYLFLPMLRTFVFDRANKLRTPFRRALGIYRRSDKNRSRKSPR